MLKEKLSPIILFPLTFMFIPASGFIISLMVLQEYYSVAIISSIVVILTCIWIVINVDYKEYYKKNNVPYRVYLTKDEIEELICGLEDLDYDIKTFSESGKSEPNPLIHKLKSIIEE